MPPILLLKGDKEFYGDIKPKPNGDSDLLEKPAPPPNPMSNVALTNTLQRQEATRRLTDNINDPDAKELPQLQAELNVKDIKKFNTKTDTTESLGSQLVSFLQKPIVPVSDETKKQQDQRELQRIGITDDNLAENQLRPVGEVPAELGNRALTFIENKGIQLIMVLGGIYLAGQFLGGAGKGIVSKKSD